MRKVAVLLVVLAVAMPAFAAKRVTVDQLWHALAAARSKLDVDLASGRVDYHGACWGIT